MKRAIIVHCWGGSGNYAWYPNVAKQLELQGYTVAIPEMPNTEEPKLDTWLPVLQNIVGEPDDELVLIGHSIGTVLIMRYLETLAEDQKIDKAIFVAGFTDQLGFVELENFFETKLDFAKMKGKAKDGFVAIQSDNDPYVSAQYGNRLKDELGAKLIIKHDAGHMSGPVDAEEFCNDLPEVLNSI